jgi:endonuclease YncB( thermonuclease family)
MATSATVQTQFKFARTTRAAAPRKLLRSSDGDTPVIEQPIRMLSCDTPEKSGYAGPPVAAQRRLEICRQRLAGDFYATALPKGLRRYLLARLGPDAAERHITAGERASAVFEALLERRLTRDDGQRRSLAIVPAGQLIDHYGRLLAYFAPYFGRDELPPKGDPRRRTFNLEMVSSGWAACFPIYPSLPSNTDFGLLIDEAVRAWTRRRGVWDEFGRTVLLAYEYRLCIKLSEVARAEDGVRLGFQRSCVDLRTRTDVGPLGFWAVPPPYRLWYWLEDAAQARVDLGLAA